MTVIILGATILAVGLAASYASQTELLVSGDADRAQYARQLASSCLDEALYRLKKDYSYTGGTIPVTADYDCQVTVSGVGATRSLSATATDLDVTQTIEATADLRLNNGGNARSWYVSAWSIADP